MILAKKRISSLWKQLFGYYCDCNFVNFEKMNYLTVDKGKMDSDGNQLFVFSWYTEVPMTTNSVKSY